MRFHEIPVGDKFRFNNQEYTKVPEERISCCQIKCNCKNSNTGESAVLKPLDEVEKVVTEN